MSMDGQLRPTQLLPYTDALYRPDDAGKTYRTEKLKETQNSEFVDETNEDPEKDPNHGQGEKQQDQRFAEQLKELLKEKFKITLDNALDYEFDFNETTQRFELRDSLTQSVLLTLTPQAFADAAKSMTNSSGNMADKSA